MEIDPTIDDQFSDPMQVNEFCLFLLCMIFPVITNLLEKSQTFKEDIDEGNVEEMDDSTEIVPVVCRVKCHGRAEWHVTLRDSAVFERSVAPPTNN